MNTAKRPCLSEEQEHLLREVRVRVIEREEQERFDALIVKQHYLKSARLVGEQVRYVAEYQGQWVALLSWSAGAFKLKLREEHVGWTDRQKKQRLPLVVNNSRFLILEGFHAPNLGSRVMKLCLERLSADWKRIHGHEVLLAETFVDEQQFRGTVYKASGWTRLGSTQGFKRDRADFYQAHHRPKSLWVRELRPGARTILRGRNPPEALADVKGKHPPECPQSPQTLRGMCAFFQGMSEWRSRRGIDFPISGLVALCLCAILCKVTLGQRDLAAFAGDLSEDQLEALGFRRDWDRRGRHFKRPGETTFFRLLSNLKSDELERALLHWQDHVLGRRDPHGDQVCIDGKELLHSQGMQIVSAYSVRDGRWLGSQPVEEDSNEIPAAQQLLPRLDIEGSLVCADAMHTQDLTAQITVQEKGADYLFTVKGNQKGVQKNVQQLHKGLLHAFSP